MSHAYLVHPLSAAELPCILGPPEFCAHVASWMLYVNGTVRTMSVPIAPTSSAHNMLHYLIRLPLQNTSSKIKLVTISRWRQQRFKPSSGPAWARALPGSQATYSWSHEAGPAHCLYFCHTGPVVPWPDYVPSCLRALWHATPTAWNSFLPCGLGVFLFFLLWSQLSCHILRWALPAAY